MADRLTLRILLPTREAVARKVDSVNLPAAEGEVGILPGHAPLLAQIKPGPAWFRDGATVERWAIGDGFLEVNSDVVTVMVQSAERSDEIDVARAEKRKAEREAQIRSGELATVSIEVAELSLRKQLARIEVARGSTP